MKGKHELELLKFIDSHPDWKSVIQEKPYCVTVKENNAYILLSYSQIDSDFSLELVRECRGIILRKSDLKIVCYPFDKFFNVQEGHASEIDWKSARVQQKVDGSILKLWFDMGGWRISTNGTIDAINAELQTSVGQIKNYRNLFLSAENFSPDMFEKMNFDKTYIFELTSPYNKIVVPYSKTEIWHIGTRDNNTFEESNEYIGIQKPKEYNLWSATECLMAVQNFPFSEEGFVVVDKFFNRIKIKSPAYVAAHHLRGNGTVTFSRIAEMIKLNAQDDFLSIYPEYQDLFENVLDKIAMFLQEVETDWRTISFIQFDSRKDLALIVNKSKCPSAIYSLYDQKVMSVREWLYNQQNDRLLNLIGIE